MLKICFENIVFFMQLCQKTASPNWHNTELQRGFLHIQLQYHSILALVQ